MAISPNWERGDQSALALVSCCPECGSANVLHRGRRAAGAEIIYWRCGDCRRTWKGTQPKKGRAVII